MIVEEPGDQSAQFPTARVNQQCPHTTLAKVLWTPPLLGERKVARQPRLAGEAFPLERLLDRAEELSVVNTVCRLADLLPHLGPSRPVRVAGISWTRRMLGRVRTARRPLRRLRTKARNGESDRSGMRCGRASGGAAGARPRPNRPPRCGRRSWPSACAPPTATSRPPPPALPGAGWSPSGQSPRRNRQVPA